MEKRKGTVGSRTFAVVCFFMLLISFIYNISMSTTDGVGVKPFDTYSEGIMIADLAYQNHYGGISAFMHVLNPDMKFESGFDGSYDAIRRSYLFDTPPVQSEFGVYYSNICFHRFMYAVIDSIFTDHEHALNVMHLTNAFLFALMLTVILTWICMNFSYIVAYTLLIFSTFFMPYLTMYSTNLYWSVWSLFLPIAASVFVVESRYFEKEHSHYWVPMWVAFFACTIKQLLYFEYVSTAMVGLTIPYLYFAVLNRFPIKKIIKVFIYLILGAVFSFLFVSIVKMILLMLSVNSFSNGLTIFIEPILRRLIGSQGPVIMEQGNTTVTALAIIKTMLSQPSISIGHLGTISQAKLGVISLCASLLLGGLCLSRRSRIILGIDVLALYASVLASLLAPMSWFILAIPHVYIHPIHNAVNWFLPFVFFECTLIMVCMYSFFEQIKNALHAKNRCVISLYKYWPILVAIVLIVGGYIGYTYFELHNQLKRIEEKSSLVYSADDMKVYYCAQEDSLYFATYSSKGKKVMVHFILDEQYLKEMPVSEAGYVSKNDSESAFINRDFVPGELTDSQIYAGNRRIDSMSLPPYPIRSIQVGTYLYKGTSVINVLQSDNVSLHSDVLQKTEAYLSPANINDSNWNNGIHVSGNIILIEGFKRQYLYLIGRKFLSVSGCEVTISNVQRLDTQWTYIYVTPSLSMEDGYPRILEFMPEPD